MTDAVQKWTAKMTVVLVNLVHPVSHHGRGGGGGRGGQRGHERVGGDVLGHRACWDKESSTCEGQLLARSDLNEKKKKRNMPPACPCE